MSTVVSTRRGGWGTSLLPPLAHATEFPRATSPVAAEHQAGSRPPRRERHVTFLEDGCIILCRKHPAARGAEVAGFGAADCRVSGARGDAAAARDAPLRPSRAHNTRHTSHDTSRALFSSEDAPNFYCERSPTPRGTSAAHPNFNLHECSPPGPSRDVTFESDDAIPTCELVPITELSWRPTESESWAPPSGHGFTCNGGRRADQREGVLMVVAEPLDQEFPEDARASFLSDGIALTSAGLPRTRTRPGAFPPSPSLACSHEWRWRHSWDASEQPFPGGPGVVPPRHNAGLDALVEHPPALAFAGATQGPRHRHSASSQSWESPRGSMRVLASVGTAPPRMPDQGGLVPTAHRACTEGSLGGETVSWGSTASPMGRLPESSGNTGPWASPRGQGPVGGGTMPPALGGIQQWGASGVLHGSRSRRTLAAGLVTQALPHVVRIARRAAI